ncbi:hypothetical protein GCM10010517_16770 [Streptosporangium fragile]|uniref:Secreted protein n=1 Tax=Streptosporangium fragile TaxID=46186 RepID=A0ABP6I9H3_9ACTN
MRARRLVAAVLMAGGLVAGVTSGPAVAATATVAQADPSWHLAGYYQYRNECVRTGFQAITSGGIVQDFKCELAGNRFALYLFY